MKLSKFLPADHLDFENGLGVYIKVVEDNSEFIPTFFLSMPDRDIALEEFHTLADGIKDALYKIQQLIEIFEDGLDS